MADSLRDLERLSYGELVKRWRATAEETPATPSDYYAELARRNVTRVNNLLLLFTFVVTVAAVIALLKP